MATIKTRQSKDATFKEMTSSPHLNDIFSNPVRSSFMHDSINPIISLTQTMSEILMARDHTQHSCIVVASGSQ